MDGRHGSKNVVLIMPSGWTDSGGVGVRSSQRCKAKWKYWALHQRLQQRPLCRRNIVKIGKMATRVDCRFLATSDLLIFSQVNATNVNIIFNWQHSYSSIITSQTSEDRNSSVGEVTYQQSKPVIWRGQGCCSRRHQYRFKACNPSQTTRAHRTALISDSVALSQTPQPKL